VEVIASDFSYSRGVFFFRDVHPVMRHAVAKEEFDGFQGSLVVLSPVYTQPLEIRRHQQIAPALNARQIRAPKVGWRTNISRTLSGEMRIASAWEIASQEAAARRPVNKSMSPVNCPSRRRIK